MDASDEMYLLIDPELLRTLMKRTGTGARITVRELAEAVDVHPSLVGFLLTGRQRTTTETTAKAIATRLGVDLLILWSPVGRSTPAPAGEYATAVSA